MKKAFLPLLIIATGIGWILSTNNIMPGVNWAWILVIAVAGIMSMCDGLNKLTFVLGPMLLISSVMIVLLQSERLKIEMGFPVLVTSLGLLMLVARLSSLPDAFKDPGNNDPQDPTES